MVALAIMKFSREVRVNVRFCPLCRLKSDISRGPRSANSRLMHCSIQRARKGAHRSLNEIYGMWLAASVRFNAGVLDHLGPGLRFRADQRGKFYRRIGN